MNMPVKAENSPAYVQSALSMALHTPQRSQNGAILKSKYGNSLHTAVWAASYSHSAILEGNFLGCVCSMSLCWIHSSLTCEPHHDLLRCVLHAGDLLLLALQLQLPGLQAGPQLVDELLGCFQIQRCRVLAYITWMWLSFIMT